LGSDGTLQSLAPILPVPCAVLFLSGIKCAFVSKKDGSGAPPHPTLFFPCALFELLIWWEEKTWSGWILGSAFEVMKNLRVYLRKHLSSTRVKVHLDAIGHGISKT